LPLNEDFGPVRNLPGNVYSTSDWEHVGGPFWLVQEEILRFGAIHIFQ
jgi:hypothetical protein